MIIKMIKELFNPDKGRGCQSCAYLEKKRGNEHNGCLRNFPLGVFLNGTLTTGIEMRKEDVAVYIDANSVKMVAKGELDNPIACTVRINKFTKTFPLDFDTRWVVACLGWSDEPDERFITKRSGLEEIVGILGSVGRI